MQQRYEVLLVDLRGFGYSGGPRGCSEIEDLHRDALAVIKEANPTLPLFLYGHSLGALVLVTLTYEYLHLNVSGLILTSPFFGLPIDRKLPWIKRFLVKAVGKDMEDFVVNSMINPTALTKSNRHIHTIFTDRLMIPFLSVKMARSILINIETVQTIASHFTLPVIIFHGKHDSVTNYHDSVNFIDQAVSKHKKLHLFDNGYHELQHDEECDEMLRIASCWLPEIPTSPLGALNLQRRRPRKGAKLPWKWIVLAVVLYLIAAIRIVRTSSSAKRSFLQALLGPVVRLLGIKTS